MKTAQEILDEYGCPEIPFDESITMFYPSIIEAMEEYANQFKSSTVCDDLCHSLPTTPFEGAICRKCGKLK